MAIIFNKEVSQDNLLKSHDDNIVEFYSDNALAEESCNIDFGSVSFDITPDPTGVFSYNLKEVVSVLINSQNFKDAIVSDAHNGNYSLADSNLYLAVSVTYRITFPGGTTESTSRNYKFIRGVNQPIKYLNNVIDTTSSSLTLLLPFFGNSKTTFYAPYFDGLPFDVPVWVGTTGNFVVENITNGMSHTFPMTAGVNRLFVSDGANNWGLDSILPLRHGINVLEIYPEGSSSEAVTLHLERYPVECGLYFRYHNTHGGYSYYRCNAIHRESLRTRTIDSLSPAYADISQAIETDVISGKESGRILNLRIDLKNRDARKYLEELLDSPRVDMFLDTTYNRAEADSWLGVRVLDGTFETENTKNPYGELKFQVGITKNSLVL